MNSTFEILNEKTKKNQFYNKEIGNNKNELDTDKMVYKNILTITILLIFTILACFVNSSKLYNHWFIFGIHIGVLFFLFSLLVKELNYLLKKVLTNLIRDDESITYEKEKYSNKNKIGGNEKMGSWLNFKINKEEEEASYIDENETYSFGDDSEEPIHSEKQEKYINVDKSKEEDFNKFIEIKSFLSEQLKGDVGRSRIDSAILILEKKFKSNLDLIYKGTTNYKIKQNCISDNDNILSNLKEIIFEYNLKEQELLKEKDQELIEDSLLQIKKCLDISILSKSSC